MMSKANSPVTNFDVVTLILHFDENILVLRFLPFQLCSWTCFQEPHALPKAAAIGSSKTGIHRYTNTILSGNFFANEREYTAE